MFCFGPAKAMHCLARSNFNALGRASAAGRLFARPAYLHPRLLRQTTRIGPNPFHRRWFALPGVSKIDLERKEYQDQDNTWVDRFSPSAARPYLKLIRIDRPIGTMLLFWPCGWSIALAGEAGSLPDMRMLALFATGAFVMRGAGCTINDMWDKDFDKKVTRTKFRPLAAGDISPVQALVFLGGQMCVGLCVLLQLNDYSVALGASSLVLVGTYPLFKRVTNFPQAVLGLTFNWGALLGWASVHGNCDWSIVLPLYFAGVSWTMIYDTWYAHQDKLDDSKLGLRSTALAWGNKTKLWVSVFSVSMVSGLGLAGINAGLGHSIPLGVGLAATSAHLVWQISTANLDRRVNLNDRFRSNNVLGMIIFGTYVTSQLLV
jgi:4-hydroxybenzoate polyprenyltransferase